MEVCVWEKKEKGWRKEGEEEGEGREGEEKEGWLEGREGRMCEGNGGYIGGRVWKGTEGERKEGRMWKGKGGEWKE